MSGWKDYVWLRRRRVKEEPPPSGGRLGVACKTSQVLGRLTAPRASSSEKTSLSTRGEEAAAESSGLRSHGAVVRPGDEVGSFYLGLGSGSSPLSRFLLIKGRKKKTL